MEQSSFIVEFHPHLNERDWHTFMLSVGAAGATARWISGRSVELTCIKRSQLQHVGFIIYRVAEPALGRVVGVKGEAQARASHYARYA